MINEELRQELKELTRTKRKIDEEKEKLLKASELVHRYQMLIQREKGLDDVISSKRKEFRKSIVNTRTQYYPDCDHLLVAYQGRDGANVWKGKCLLCKGEKTFIDGEENNRAVIYTKNGLDVKHVKEEFLQMIEEEGEERAKEIAKRRYNVVNGMFLKKK